MKNLLLLAVLVTLAGCGSSGPPATATQPDKNAQVLESKLKGIPPAQRAEYLRQHPEELKNLSGAGAKPVSK
jgi:predicted small lipoprotein YifL